MVAVLVGAFGAQWLLELIEKDRLAGPEWLMGWLALDSSSPPRASGGSFSPSVFSTRISFTSWRTCSCSTSLVVSRSRFSVGGTSSEFRWRYFARRRISLHRDAGVSLVGVSAGVAAVVAAYSTTLPEFEVVGHLFFVIPLKVRAKFFGIAIAVIGAACWAANIQPIMGPASVLFGSAFGWVYARQLGFGNPFWWQRRIYERRQRAQRLARMSADQFVSEEIDPILEKIAREGMESLTREERRILSLGSTKVSTRK
jgi:hypothetical protein